MSTSSISQANCSSSKGFEGIFEGHGDANYRKFADRGTFGVRWSTSVAT
jgi:hypothetical protein